jgi:hypothetical protein
MAKKSKDVVLNHDIYKKYFKQFAQDIGLENKIQKEAEMND